MRRQRSTASRLEMEAARVGRGLDGEMALARHFARVGPDGEHRTRIKYIPARLNSLPVHTRALCRAPT